MKHKNNKGNLRINGPKSWMVLKSAVTTPRFHSGDVKSSGLFIGPSVEGADKEYIKVLSGKVEHKKPSFVL